MRIAFIGTAHPYRGGLATYNERLVREFVHQGHEATLFTFSLQYPNFLFPGKTQMSTDPAPDDIEIVQCLNSVNPLNWISVGRKIRRYKPDLILTKYWLPFMGPALGTTIGQASKGGKSVAIAIADNIVPHEKRPGDKMFTRYFLNKVDGVVGMTQSVLDDLDLFNADMPRVLSPHPLFDAFGDAVPREQALQDLGLDPDDRYLLFFGFIREYKGLDLLIEALEVLKKRDFGAKLIIAGEFYDDKERYMNLIDRAGVSDRIIMHDHFISNSEVKTYFNAADLVVQPYKTATQSGVTQIAYHFDKPMVVTNVGGLPEMCPDGKVGYVVEPKAGAIASAIERFYTDTDHDAMHANILQEKKKYSWATLVDNIHTLHNLVKSK